jgi:hypothetical protein
MDDDCFVPETRIRFSIALISEYDPKKKLPIGAMGARLVNYSFKNSRNFY